MSAAAGALSRPMLVQLTTQDCRGPAAGTQLQLAGHGLQLRAPGPGGPEPRASRHQSATNRKEQKLNLGTQTPCFRLDKVCPFPQGIAHSHLHAWDGSKSAPWNQRKVSAHASPQRRQMGYAPFSTHALLSSNGRVCFLRGSSWSASVFFGGKKKFWRTSSLLLLLLLLFHSCSSSRCR